MQQGRWTTLMLNGCSNMYRSNSSKRLIPITREWITQTIEHCNTTHTTNLTDHKDCRNLVTSSSPLPLPSPPPPSSNILIASTRGPLLLLLLLLLCTPWQWHLLLLLLLLLASSIDPSLQCCNRSSPPQLPLHCHCCFHFFF